MVAVPEGLAASADAKAPPRSAVAQYGQDVVDSGTFTHAVEVYRRQNCFQHVPLIIREVCRLHRLQTRAVTWGEHAAHGALLPPPFQIILPQRCRMLPCVGTFLKKLLHLSHRILLNEQMATLQNEATAQLRRWAALDANSANLSSQTTGTSHAAAVSQSTGAESAAQQQTDALLDELVAMAQRDINALTLAPTARDRLSALVAVAMARRDFVIAEANTRRLLLSSDTETMGALASEAAVARMVTVRDFQAYRASAHAGAAEAAEAVQTMVLVQQWTKLEAQVVALVSGYGNPTAAVTLCLSAEDQIATKAEHNLNDLRTMELNALHA